MNTIIFASLLLSAVTAHAYPYLSHPEASSAYAYDSHGHLLSAHDSHGSGVYGSHGLQKDSGIAVHDSHAISSHADRKAHEVDSDHYNKYKNVGAYSHEKGDGFEKTYHYEKVNGHHDIVADHDALKTSYGNHGAKSYHDSRDHGASGHSSYGSYNKYGANGFGSTDI
ncbi:hypothetical protein HNY73_019057 [Argiope bruennichi]|uniref:Uncharacterized protein n=1 Tax=Argiope bruennichi TaxID=94029 RepID=A0A8T0EG36_ARGBR|nr:hypothetical protein HNY73_019057 [Argiope bruennichi]